MPNTVGSAYGKVMYEREGVLATWFPDRQLRVGDVVSRSETTGVLTVETTLSDLIADTTHPTVTRKGPESVVLQRGVSITFEGGAETNAVGAAAELAFDHSSSFVFAAQAGHVDQYERLAPIRSEMLALYLHSRWSAEWQLVTAVSGFKSAVVIVARKSGTAARVSVASDKRWAGFEAVAAAAGMSITRGDAAHWEMKNATPLYEALEVRPGGLFRGAGVVEGRYLDADQSQSADLTVVRSTPHDLSV